MQTHRIDIPASEIKLGDTYITRAAFAAERRREVIGLRAMVGPDESAYVELTLKSDAIAINGSEASVPTLRVVTVEREGAQLCALDSVRERTFEDLGHGQ